MNIDSIIVGGGIIGMLTARELSSAGQKVLLLDKSLTGKESSWAGGGIISPLYPWRYDASITALAHWSQRQYASRSADLLASSNIDPEYTISGLMISTDEAELSKASIWSDQHQHTFEAIHKDQNPAFLDFSAIQANAGIWYPEVAQIRNPRLIKSLRKTIENQGVTILEQQEVTAYLQQHQQIQGVQTKTERYHSDNVIIACGAWTGQTLQATELALNIEPVLGQMILFDTKPGQIPHMILSEGRYVIPRRDGKVLVGSTVEHTGFNKRTTEAAKQSLLTSARALIPSLKDANVIHHWAGLRPGSENGIPTICEHPKIKGLYINAGHFRNGVVLAPASCRLMADIILKRDPILDPTPYKI